VDLHTEGDIGVQLTDLVGGYTRITLLQRFTEFEDARAYSLALFYLAFVRSAPLEFVFDDYTYQSAIVRSSDLSDQAKQSLIRATKLVQSERGIVLTDEEIHFAGDRREHTISTAIGADLVQFQVAPFIGRDFVEAVDRDIGAQM
jgi:hypothetical protein